MKKRKTIKKEAKGLLEGKWAKYIISFAILFAFDIVIMLVGGIAEMLIFDFGSSMTYIAIPIMDILIFALIFLLSLAYLLGEKGKYFALADGENPNATDSMQFLSVKGFWHTIKVLFALIFRILLWAIIFALPFAAIYGGYYALDYFNYSSLELPLNIIAVLYSVFYILAVLTAAQRYFLVPYISSIQPELKISDVCKSSVKFMKGHKIRVLTCKFSFILWAVLSFLILPMLYTLPYYNAVMAIYAQKIYNK